MEEEQISKINLEQPILSPPKIELNVVDDSPTFSKMKFKKPNFKFSLSKRSKKIVLGSGGALLILTILLVFFAILPAYNTYKKALITIDSARAVQASLNSQDINQVKGKLAVLGDDLRSTQSSYNRLSWIKVLPWAGNYWKDGDAGIKAGLHAVDTARLIIETLEPYADVIGFAGPGGEEAQSGEETANDRIDFVVSSIEEVLPKMDEITHNAQLAQDELQKIDPNRYPEQFRGKAIRSKLKQGLDLAEQGTDFLADSKPLMEAAPFLLGNDEERTYLLIFQNDKELRPTGGFMTGYSIINVNVGKVNPTASNDIYNLDGNYKATLEAPEPIVRLIKEPYSRFPELRLRDMNWNPDFRVSMELFLAEAESVGIRDIDGVIAVDTQVVVNLLEAIGQIGVPGFGNFSAEQDPRCDCPQVIYELESFADVEGAIVWSENEPGKIVFAPPNYENRKKIVGPLMNSVLSNALGQPSEKIPDLFEAAWNSVTQKHVLVYVLDEDAQRGIEQFGIGGRIEETDGDYLHVNDANLGGRKSNLYVKNEIDQQVDIAKDGTTIKTLTLTYKNPQPQDGWLNSVLPNWTRVYVPLGSELIDVEGFEMDGETTEENGKTVFSGGFELRPEGVKKIVITYRLPFKVEDEYRLLIQKQPGLDAPLYTIKVGKQLEELFLRTDKEFKFKI